MTRYQPGGILAVAAAVPASIVLVAHPPTAIMIATLLTEITVALGRWLLLLRRDRQRQLAAETLLRACGDQPARIHLDSGGSIEVHRHAPGGGQGQTRTNCA